MPGALARRLIEFLKEEDGPTAVEYAVMLAMIIVVCFAAINTIGGKTNEHLNNMALKTALSGAAS